ncbi:ankyrin repeat and SOCS box protein 1-like [Glandiceps talaboti]
MAEEQTVYEDECQWPIHPRDSFLHQAAYIGHLGKLQECLRDKKNLRMIDSKNRLGCTPLRLAATKGNKACLECLLKYGCKVDIADMKAQTALYMAVQNNHIECVRTLLKVGANPNGDAGHLCTPLYIAAMRGSLLCIQELLDYGADINSAQILAGSFNSTALYISFTYQHMDCFKWLLCSGADPNYGISSSGTHPTIISPSLFNAAVRRREQSWIQLLVDFDAFLDLNDDNLRRLQNPHDNDKEFMEFLFSTIHIPRTLKSLCRITIRKLFSYHRLYKIKNLPLPRALKDYLFHK